MYFLTSQIVRSSASSTNSFHMSCFALFTACLNSSRLSLHSWPCPPSLVLRYLFLALLAPFLRWDRLLLHQRLLWGLGFFRGVVSVNAWWMASIIAVVNRSKSFGVAVSGSMICGK